MEDFNQLYEMYFEQLYKFLYSKTGDAILAEELTQETFYQAFKSIRKFKGDSKTSTWLYGIAKNVYLKYIRKKLHCKELALEFDVPIGINPESVFEHKERNITLMKAIHQLKDPQKEIIMLRAFGELSFKEIGEVFNKSENWARVNFYRGKLDLDNIINQKEEE